MSNPIHILGLLIIACISIAGWRIRSLTGSGAAAAFITGVLIYLGYGFQGLFLLGAFFASSSLLSKYKRNRKMVLDEMLEKGDRRDSIQVMANGGISSIASFLFWLTGADLWTAVFCTSIAAANSDTWASEIGTLSRKAPRMLLSFKKTVRGTSGAVSPLGTIAAAAGALFIAILSVFIFQLSWRWGLMIAVLGFFGNLADTLLGGSVQVKYKCPVCGKVTEKRIHCSKEGRVVQGNSFFNNDVVNILSISIAALLSVCVFIIF
ncbi:DUF92 domain-containing protein [Bacillus sp. FJAT-42376]|uniref:DUF92 domain-containing protein n=1 Tax=Bacillus sp. FJAT-42376 TaxID=2014076 RepID=UPI000F509AF8|nr:DUF92 domain-containing protein [Bacillus sp. FJAT-42376]AZB43619.1 DUF92 domain-containing protein [Bacillus sp. FJAT-42376]